MKIPTCHSYGTGNAFVSVIPCIDVTKPPFEYSEWDDWNGFFIIHITTSKDLTPIRVDGPPYNYVSPSGPTYDYFSLHDKELKKRKK